MNKYKIVGPFWRFRRVIEVSNTLHLRREVRRYIGWRKSAKYNYRQIGTNSFIVENWLGWIVLEIYII